MSEKIFQAFLESPVGILRIEANENEIRSVLFAHEKKKNGRQPAVLKNCLKQLKEYFYEGRKKFTLPLELSGSAWQKKVWQELTKIPFGKTVSYAELAEKLGGKKMARAVASACAQNKILFIIPCHRVIGSQGGLTGYRGGLKHKKWLLDFEKKV
ncbi:MAG TPA: methylated-DNA--[protein]-cysteine S-methyltransferase [Candidatus Nanoarchaeia archaeon]|nr:methylated-DNA--[protein]-cysteine S-methyltransferase [Candidatus Nanoarchaeia archaeon]